MTAAPTPVRHAGPTTTLAVSEAAVRPLVRGALAACPARAPSLDALTARWRLRASVLRLAALNGAANVRALRRAAWVLATGAARAEVADHRAMRGLLRPAAAPRPAMSPEPAAVAAARAVVAAELAVWLLARRGESSRT